MDFHGLSRRELQALCKKNKIPANITNVAMADALKALEIVEGLDDFTNQLQSNPSQSPAWPTVKSSAIAGTATRTGRRKTTKEEAQIPQSVTRSCHTTRRTLAGEMDEENKNMNVLQTPAAPATRRRAAAASSASRKLETNVAEDKDDAKVVADVPKTPAARSTRRRAPAASTTAQRVYSTRRSVKLLEESLAELSLNGKETLEPAKIEGSEKEVVEKEEKKDPAGDVSGTKLVVGSEQKVSEISPEQNLSETLEKEWDTRDEVEGDKASVHVDLDVELDATAETKEKKADELVDACLGEDVAENAADEKGSDDIPVSEPSSQVDNEEPARVKGLCSNDDVEQDEDSTIPEHAAGAKPEEEHQEISDFVTNEEPAIQGQNLMLGEKLSGTEKSIIDDNKVQEDEKKTGIFKHDAEVSKAEKSIVVNMTEVDEDERKPRSLEHDAKKFEAGLNDDKLVMEGKAHDEAMDEDDAADRDAPEPEQSDNDSDANLKFNTEEDSNNDAVDKIKSECEESNTDGDSEVEPEENASEPEQSDNDSDANLKFVTEADSNNDAMDKMKSECEESNSDCDSEVEPEENASESEENESQSDSEEEAEENSFDADSDESVAGSENASESEENESQSDSEEEAEENSFDADSDETVPGSDVALGDADFHGISASEKLVVDQLVKQEEVESSAERNEVEELSADEHVDSEATVDSDVTELNGCQKSKTPIKTPVSPVAAELISGQFPRPTLSGKSSAKKHESALKLTLVADNINKENIDGSGRKVEPKKDKVKKKKKKMIDDESFNEISLRQLTKLVKSLEINKAEESRKALQALPGNHVPEEN